MIVNKFCVGERKAVQDKIYSVEKWHSLILVKMVTWLNIVSFFYSPTFSSALCSVLLYHSLSKFSKVIIYICTVHIQCGNSLATRILLISFIISMQNNGFN